MGLDDKLRVLKRVARALNKSGARWAVGGSLMLYLRGAAAEFADIDVVAATEDAVVAAAALEAVAARVERPPADDKARIFRSACFLQYELEGIEIELMAGMAVETGEEVYRDPFDEHGPDGAADVMGERVPLCAVADWRALYARMPGRERRVRAIDRWLAARPF